MEKGNIWQGERIRLRALEPEDWETFFEWDADSEFARYTCHVDFPSSREAAKRWAAEQAVAEAKNYEFRWVIETLDGEFIGTINTHTCESRMGTFRYGVAIRRKHWRQGHAVEAVRLVLRHFFRELRYRKVNVEVYAFNEASLELHRRMRFREEGWLRRMIHTGGACHDSIILGLTAEEFDAVQLQ